MAESPWRCSQCGTINEPVANSCRTCGRWPSLFDLQDSVVEDEEYDLAAARRRRATGVRPGRLRARDDRRRRPSSRSRSSRRSPMPPRARTSRSARVAGGGPRRSSRSRCSSTSRSRSSSTTDDATRRADALESRAVLCALVLVGCGSDSGGAEPTVEGPAWNHNPSDASAGPTVWGDIDQSFEQCGTGASQSPVDIAEAIRRRPSGRSSSTTRRRRSSSGTRATSSRRRCRRRAI